MSPSRMDRLESLLERASALVDRDRAAFIAREAGDDALLHADLAELACASEGAERFIAGLREELLGSTVPGLFREAPTDHRPDPWIGRTVSHYRILERVGDGGMGVVYAAEDLKLGRRVALKFIAPEISGAPAATSLFMREARTASAIDHPNICTIHEIAEADGGRLFIVMPEYEGETLRSRLRRGPLSRQEAIDIAEQVARALATAHERGIVHGDVKPANVFITRDEVVKLLDFGLARMKDATAAADDASGGTLAYMSPERLDGRPADERGDVWALGAVLLEMQPGAGKELAEVIARALAVDPEERFASGADVLQAIRDCRSLVSRTPRRHVIGRRATAVAAAAGVIGLGGASQGWRAGEGNAVSAATPTVMNVLWVDDNPENNVELVDHLAEHGVHVTTALTTHQAIERYDPSVAQLVISDVGRYEGQIEEYVGRAGFQLLARLREQNENVRLVFFTSERAATLYREEALASGALGIVWTSAEILSFVGL